MTPLYEDEALLVFDKPAGLLAVPGRGDDKQDCLSLRVQARWPDARVVHRLDQATSGLMLFARGAEVQRHLSRAFASRQIDKHYVAVVAGRMPAAAGRIELPLMADWPRRPLQKVDATRRQALHHRLAAARLRRGAADIAPGAATTDRTHAPAARAPGGHRPPDPRRCAVRTAGCASNAPRGCCCMPARWPSNTR